MSLQSGHYIEADYILNHPAQDEKAVTDHLSDSWFKTEILSGLNRADIEFVDSSTNDTKFGVVGVHLTTHISTVVLD
jgi:hypothetical protein